MENKYLQTYNKRECNGCGVCAQKCPVGAIMMVEDTEGFFYPKIDEEKCIKCNKCKNICSNYNDSQGISKVFMAINKDKEELKNSSSGGMFYILAKYIISRQGIVFGVEYGDNLKVQHNYYDKIEECKKFQGSKYLRSDLRNSYEEVEKFLKQDKYVLFTGTPCQCNGLKTYLNKDYEKLILCDIICHANPSQKVFDKYIMDIEKITNKKVIKVEFRSKENGWKNQTPIITYEDGTKEERKEYFKAFVHELIGRPSCNSCKFASSERVTDFTIGDFWGIKNVLEKINDDDTGISLLTVNSEKGFEILENIKKDMEIQEVNKELAWKYNHYKNVPAHRNREKFFKKLQEESVIENIQDCFRDSFVRKVLKKIKRIVIK